ncbi:MAG: CarD family transcriptional regulator, partial [Deltaproteobacteria bacterium]
MKQKIATKNNYWQDLADKITNLSDTLIIDGMPSITRAFFASVIYTITNKTMLLVVDEKSAKHVANDLHSFLGNDAIVYFPSREFNQGIASRHQETQTERVSTLIKLIQNDKCLIVCPLQALLQPLITPSTFKDNIFKIAKGDVIERDGLIAKLVACSYRRVNLVNHQGEFAVRGGIVDIFVPSLAYPFRVEFLGDYIDEIRNFDVETQRSSGSVDEFFCTPASELIISKQRRDIAQSRAKLQMENIALSANNRNIVLHAIANHTTNDINPLLIPYFFNETATLLDFISDEVTTVIDDGLHLQEKIADIGQDIEALAFKNISTGKFFPQENDLLVDNAFLQKQLAHRKKIFFSSISVDKKNKNVFSALTHILPIITQINKGQSIISALAEDIKIAIQAGDDVFYFCNSNDEIKRITWLFASHGLYPISIQYPPAQEIMSKDAGGRFLIFNNTINDNFYLSGVLAISDSKVFGKKTLHAHKHQELSFSGQQGIFLKSFSEIQDGDYLVHIQHGIGIYHGLRSLSINGIINDFLLVSYGDGNIYIPVEKLEMVQKYIGAEGHTPKIDKIGSKSWETTRERVKASIREMAISLVNLYAKRDTINKTPADAIDSSYEEFCAKFPYEETPDQYRA